MLTKAAIPLLLVSSYFYCAANAIDGGPVASPQVISLQARAFPKGSNLRRRAALSPIDVPLDDFFLGTDLQ